MYQREIVNVEENNKPNESIIYMYIKKKKRTELK